MQTEKSQVLLLVVGCLIVGSFIVGGILGENYSKKHPRKEFLKEDQEYFSYQNDLSYLNFHLSTKSEKYIEQRESFLKQLNLAKDDVLREIVQFRNSNDYNSGQKGCSKTITASSNTCLYDQSNHLIVGNPGCDQIQNKK